MLAGGAWNPVLLAMLGAHLPITLTEEQVTYFATPKVAEFTPDRFGVYGYLADDGLYYGIPVYGEVAIKIGIDGAGPVVTPESRTFTRDERREFAGYLPSWNATCQQPSGPTNTRTCCYDLAPDRDFIADYVPESQRVLVCAGAGHEASSPHCSAGTSSPSSHSTAPAGSRSAPSALPGQGSADPQKDPSAATRCEQ